MIKSTELSHGLYGGIRVAYGPNSADCALRGLRRGFLVMVGGRLAAATCISASNCSSIPVCSPSTADQTGGCLTFILSRGATSAYFLPLVISYLISLSLIILSLWPPHLLASHLASLLFGSSLLLCHPCVERDDQA